MNGENDSTAPDSVDRLDNLIGDAFGEGGDVTATLEGDPSPDSEPTSEPDPKPAEPTNNSDSADSDSGSTPEDSTVSDDKLPKPDDSDANPDDLDSKFPDLGDDATPKAQNKWAELRGDLKSSRKELRERESKIAELEAQLQNSEGANVEPEMVTKLQEKLAEKERELSAYRVESTDLYQREVAQPLAKLAEEAEKLGGEELVKALAEVDPRVRSQALSDAVEDMNDFDRTTVYQMARDLDGVFARQSEFRENAAEAMQEIEQQRALQQTQEQAEQAKAFESAAKDAWGVFERKLPFMKGDDGELLPEYKAIMDEGLDTNLPEKPAMIQAYSSFSGLLLPQLLKEVSTLRSNNAALSETISELEGASPGGSDGSSGASPDDLGDFDDETPFGEGLEAVLASGNVSFNLD